MGKGMKHTPGPWEAEDWGDHYVVKIGEECIPISCTGKDKPNAHLIAAAPDMLELLDAEENMHMQVMEALRLSTYAHAPMVREWWNIKHLDARRSAIAKAKRKA